MLKYNNSGACALGIKLVITTLAVLFLTGNAVAETIIWDESQGSPLPFTWNYTNFDGFNDSGVGTENLTVLQYDLNSGQRTISNMNLIYSTSTRARKLNVVLALNLTDYQSMIDNGLAQVGPGQAFENGEYFIVYWQAERYVAVNRKVDKFTKLVMEQGISENKTLTVGETWDIGGGWTLYVNSIDAKAMPRQVWISLYKNGIKKDDKVISETSPIYTYVENSLAGETDVPLFVTYVESIFSGNTSDGVKLGGTWALSTDVIVIQSGSSYGIFKDANVMFNKLTLINSDTSVTLSANTIIDLMGNLKFKVYDTDFLKFSPSVGPGSTGPVHNINKGTSYTTIQAAINDASPGDEIHVDSGTYNENVNVTKQLTLRGIDNGGGMPVVDANGSGSAITLSSGGSTLEGFNVMNASANNYPHAGIKVNSNNNIIEKNIASKNYHGIWLDSSSKNKLSGNNASNNDFGIYLSSSNDNIFNDNNANSNIYNGILVSSSNNNSLSWNNANTNNQHGIYLYYSSVNIMANNNAISNAYYGIHLDHSNTNTLDNNDASINYFGIFLYSSGNNTLIGNNASNNTDSGFYLSSSNNNLLSNNNANSNNLKGIYLFSSRDNTLNSNIANSNTLGIYLDSSSKNTIYNNNFNNTYNANDNGNNIWNITKTAGTNIIGGSYLGGNYWSDYAGVDLNGDGLGDTLVPYNSSGNIANSGDFLPLTIVPTPTAGSISGFKINDSNGNGVWDASELGIPNWTIQIQYPNGIVVATVATNATGGYFVNLPPGNYTISEVSQSGWTQTFPLPSGTYTVNLTAGQTMQNASFGNRKGFNCCTPPPGMVSWWPGDGNANDIQGSNHGTLQNGATFAAGKVGQAFRFDGVNDNVKVLRNPSLNFGTGSFSIDTWINTTASSGVKVLLDKRNGPIPKGYHMFLSDGIPGFQMASGNGSSSCKAHPTPGVACTNYGWGSPSIADGVWHHIVWVVDRTNLTSGVRLYVDGVLKYNGEPMTDNLNTTSDLYMGNRTSAMGGGGFFPGYLDEIEIFNRALNQTDIQAIYNAGSAGKCKNQTGK